MIEAIEKHTESISVEQSKPLEVEFRTHYQYTGKMDSGIKRLAKYVIALFVPQTDHYAEMYLVGMTPGTALNLLMWLQEHKELLRQMDEEARA